MDDKTIDRIKRRIERNQRMIFASGTILFVLGLLRYILVPARWGINLKTQLPAVISGAEFMILGGLLLLSGFWTMRNKKKVIQMDLEDIKDKKNKRKFHYNWGRKRK